MTGTFSVTTSNYQLHFKLFISIVHRNGHEFEFSPALFFFFKFQDFVNVVKESVASVEEKVNKAENELGTVGGFMKKLSSFISKVIDKFYNSSLTLFQVCNTLVSLVDFYNASNSNTDLL